MRPFREEKDARKVNILSNDVIIVTKKKADSKTFPLNLLQHITSTGWKTVAHRL